MTSAFTLVWAPKLTSKVSRSAGPTAATKPSPHPLRSIASFNSPKEAAWESIRKITRKYRNRFTTLNKHPYTIGAALRWHNRSHVRQGEAIVATKKASPKKKAVAKKPVAKKAAPKKKSASKPKVSNVDRLVAAGVIHQDH